MPFTWDVLLAFGVFMEMVLRTLRRFGAHGEHVHNSQGVTNQLTLKITWYLQIQSQVKNRLKYNRDRHKCTSHSLSKHSFCSRRPL